MSHKIQWHEIEWQLRSLGGNCHSAILYRKALLKPHAKLQPKISQAVTYSLQIFLPKNNLYEIHLPKLCRLSTLQLPFALAPHG